MVLSARPVTNRQFRQGAIDRPAVAPVPGLTIKPMYGCATRRSNRPPRSGALAPAPAHLDSEPHHRPT